jgi:hypothetical protein
MRAVLQKKGLEISTVVGSGPIGRNKGDDVLAVKTHFGPLMSSSGDQGSSDQSDTGLTVMATAYRAAIARRFTVAKQGSPKNT